VASLDRLTPEPHVVQAIGAITTGQSFTNGLMSCQGFEGPFAPIREHECVWAKAIGGVAIQNATSGSVGYREQAARVQVGTQVMPVQDWFLGFAAGYESAQTSVGGGSANTNANRYDLGAVLKRQIGPWLFAGGLDVGYASLDNTRVIGFPAPNLTATSQSGVWHVDAKLRAAYLLQSGNLYLKPMADFDTIYVNMPAFSEYGAGALNLNVGGMSNVLFAGTPAIELGATLDGGDHYLRPHLSLGVTFLSQNSLNVQANFAGAPADTIPFLTTSSLPNVVGKVAAGVDLISARQTGGLDIRLQYDGQFANDYQSHAGSAKFSMRF
jgi:outer membrane autotransporter protein